MNTRKHVLISFTILTAGAIALAHSGDAHSEAAYSTTNDVYAGTGWKIFTQNQVYSINPNVRYVITWDSATARDKMTKTIEPAIKQLRALGIDVYNTTQVETVASTACAPGGHIVIGMKYRPAGKVATSTGAPCFNASTHALWSGKVWMDSEYKQLGGTYSLSDKIWKSAVPHEVGHAFGLDHPAGTTKNSAGDTPVMTSPNGGFASSSKFGQYTSYDLNGFKALLANYDG